MNDVEHLLRPVDRHLGEAVDVDAARRVLAHLQGWRGARGPPAEQVGDLLLVWLGLGLGLGFGLGFGLGLGLGLGLGFGLGLGY